MGERAESQEGGKTLRDTGAYPLHFTNGETEIQRGQVAQPKRHSDRNGDWIDAPIPPWDSAPYRLYHFLVV